MSLIGIDVGSSSVKAAAYSEDGKLLGVASHEITPLHPEPGSWEQDPEEVWQAASISMRSLAAEDSVRHDPPKAMAISASGRENFPADAKGRPLGNSIMGADTRGAEFEVPPPGAPVPEPWCLSCGHLRERMDPIFRLMWWRKYHPEIINKAKFYFSWYDYLAYRMTGRLVSDRSMVSRYMVYDLPTMDWSSDRVADYDIPSGFLPEIQPWGTLIGEVKPALAADWGLPPAVKLAQGCHDIQCCGIGAGVLEVGTVCLVSGSYENLLVPTRELPTASMLLRGLSVMPYPCKAGLSVIAVHPTGNAVLNWARELLGVAIQDMDRKLRAETRAPSPVTAVPNLSGSMTYWEGGRKAKGALAGLTLATSGSEVVQALMESISYDLVNTLSLFREEGIETRRIRITGGGSRSSWWSQLKADITNMPLESVEQLETGTLGAALLAGLAMGIYDDLDKVGVEFAGTREVYLPDPERAALHQERLASYNKLMALLLEHIY